MTTPREAASAVSAFLGAQEGGRSEEALARLIQKGGKSGYFSLTQADFDAVQDAYDDSIGRPRRKKQNPIVWKIQHWMHWHIVDPLHGLLIDIEFWLRDHIHRPRRVHVVIARNETEISEHDYGRRRAKDAANWAANHGHRTEHLDRILVIHLETDEAINAYYTEFGHV